ncbi:alpha/beta hydrolase [Ruania alba]|uniref:Lysophospholipase, alpha-beta hydrolase superfamily n=1 Tax=Ruania alba TaxID=648782 RepID=A0A1H5MJZ2_9MICO|nr:alpha/beta hydrolase [Ruania alba]SEE89679.1 Lysophospholipase, alpha-beta hydrolase superfamily [Ruania alba]
MSMDVLGGPWVQQTLQLRPDGTHPDPVATLVHQDDAGSRPRAVLYLHGFTDYFFQAEHAQGWTDTGFDFYALDLRDYGRSIRPGRTPNFVTDLSRYDEEIGLALAQIRAAGAEEVVLLGHSTGGLIASLYASDHGGVDALVLNSPWFDLNSSWVNRVLTTRVLDAVGRWLPVLRVSTLGEPYGRSLHTSTGGEWGYDLAWKPFEDVPVYAGWLRAIRRGHARIARGLDVHAPVLVCTAGRSGHPDHPTDADLAGADCVLDVQHMWDRAPRLGVDVTVRRFQGGRHDLALSAEPVRQEYARVVLAWVDTRLPAL